MTSVYLSQFLALAAIHLMAVISPGPDFAVTISQSVRFGRKIGLLTAWGIGLGLSVHLIYTLLGMGVVLSRWPALSTVTRLIGGAYLAYLGLKLILTMADKTHHSPPADEGEYASVINKVDEIGHCDRDNSRLLSGVRLASAPPNASQPKIGFAPLGRFKDCASRIPSARAAFVTGFLTNATNPKATLFFLSIFTNIVSVSTPMILQIGYGVWMCVVTALWFSLVSGLFSTARVREAFERLGHWFNRVMGAFLLTLALRLIVPLGPINLALIALGFCALSVFLGSSLQRLNKGALTGRLWSIKKNTKDG